MKTLFVIFLLLSLLLPQASFAARQTNGTDQSLQSASALSLGNPDKYAISFWLWWDTYANDSHIAVEYSTNSSSGSTSSNRFLIIPNQSGGNFDTRLTGLSALAQDASFARANATAGAWHHNVFNVDISIASNSIVSYYIDGSSQSLSRSGTGTFAADSIDDQVLYLMSRANTSLFAAGRIASLAIWTGANLSGANVTSLNGGTAPPDVSVSGGTLLYYWTLCGTTSPEPPTTGAINMTVNGATQVAHPSAIAAECPASAVLQPSAPPFGTILK